MSRSKDLRQEVADCQKGIGILLDPFEILVDAFEDLLVGRVLKIVDPEAGLLVVVIFLKDIQNLLFSCKVRLGIWVVTF